MIETRLSPEILQHATLRGREYAWPTSQVEATIRDATEHGLATLGGQAQFRLDQGTCELYWISIDPQPRREDESWSKWVDRSAKESIEQFNEIMEVSDWSSELANWPYLKEQADAGVPVMERLCFVLYFESA